MPTTPYLIGSPDYATGGGSATGTNTVALYTFSGGVLTKVAESTGSATTFSTQGFTNNARLFGTLSAVSQANTVDITSLTTSAANWVWAGIY